MRKELTVKELREELSKHHPDTEITFGSSKFRMRPLIFYRFKKRGEKLLQIELSELEEHFEPVAECNCRPTVGDFLDHLKIWDDDYEVEFGTSLDAVALEFTSFSKVLGINLDQFTEPKWQVS